MFKKKKLYKIVYNQPVTLTTYATYYTIISAKDEHQAINKFHKITEYEVTPTIISLEEYIAG